MKYFGGCDVGSTYTKAVILDENRKMCADTTIRSNLRIARPDATDDEIEAACRKAAVHDLDVYKRQGL